MRVSAMRRVYPVGAGGTSAADAAARAERRAYGQARTAATSSTSCSTPVRRGIGTEARPRSAFGTPFRRFRLNAP